MKDTSETKSVSVRTVLKVGSIVAVVLFVVASVLVYFFPHNPASLRVRNIMPYPAIIVNSTQPIFFRDVDKDIVSIRRFYESQSDDLSKAGLRIDFSTPDGQRRLMIREKELLNKMVEDKAIAKLAHERGIATTPEAVSQADSQKIGAIGNSEADVTAQLNRLYGWNIADFEQKIVQPEMYRDELMKVYAKGTDTSSAAKEKIAAAQGELKQRTSFDEVARKYSEGTTASDGGELGWIPASSLTSEINQAIQKQKIGQASDVIESPLGFHIVVIEERKQEQEQDMFRIKQIFTRKVTFSDWLTGQMKRMNVVVLFKGYMWDKETARIEFKQPEMRAFEEEALQKSQGDSSLLF